MLSGRAALHGLTPIKEVVNAISARKCLVSESNSDYTNNSTFFFYPIEFC